MRRTDFFKKIWDQKDQMIQAKIHDMMIVEKKKKRTDKNELAKKWTKLFWWIT